MSTPDLPPPPVAADGFDLAGRGVVITGGTSGVGLATAIAFARAGVRRPVLVGRNQERGKDAVRAVVAAVPDADPQFLAADANDPVMVEDAAATAVGLLGRVDVLVNSTVAPYQPTLLHHIPLADVATILTQQALGPLMMSRALLPHMQQSGGGSIINIASDAARVPTPGETVLGAAMAAIVTFSRTLAVEGKRNGVRVNVITPSLIVNTGSYDRAMSLEFSKKIFDKIVSQAHLGLTEPEDLANTVLFLASDLSRRITGQVISINGGISVA
ncbi:SDR family oxidoreductase [Nakamurella sp. YIM 132087]|uniref:SDR family oxidoreductase n=1 Tax=Nakamurella alba TaxID=2665158 RepID=A0A7K1FEH2_9ACTN|nr:SDR family oxidoreductase [Nakamurella alba]MTD12502.1 SDR family oxidoreductase [Nakamurella alba]